VAYTRGKVVARSRMNLRSKISDGTWKPVDGPMEMLWTTMDRFEANLLSGAVTGMIDQRERQKVTWQCWAREAEVQKFGRRVATRGWSVGDVLDNAG
jgi:hypothetical protein